jgi:hypothetical protein
MHIETAAEAKAQPPWAVAVEEVVGEIVGTVVVSVATFGLADVAVGAAVGTEVIVDSGAAVSEELVSSVVDVEQLDASVVETEVLSDSELSVTEEELSESELSESELSEAELNEAVQSELELVITQPVFEQTFDTIEVLDDDIVSSSFQTDTIITDSDVSMEVELSDSDVSLESEETVYEDLLPPDLNIFDQISAKLSEWASDFSDWFRGFGSFDV